MQSADRYDPIAVRVRYNIRRTRDARAIRQGRVIRADPAEDRRVREAVRRSIERHMRRALIRLSFR